MARFNQSTPSTRTTNLAGGAAYSQDPKMELVSLLLTSMVQDQYYRKTDDTLKRLGELMDVVDPVFAAKAALYARREFGMRSISHVVAANIAKRVKGEKWTRRFFDSIVYRPDDMTEIMSYYKSLGADNEPNAMKKGFAAAFSRFNAYQLAKYRGEGKKIGLVDIANLVHPAHTPAVAALISGKLKNTDTWESKQTQAGKEAKNEEQKAQLKADAWRDMLADGTLPYFALLRNLRNIVEQAPDMIDIAVVQLTNKEAIHHSLVLPFRYFTAYQELRNITGPGSRKALEGISAALDISTDNIPDFPGRSLVVVDHSGSMESDMSDKSKATNFQVGALFGLALAKHTNSDFMYFGDAAKYYQVTSDSITGQLAWLDKCNSGGWYSYRPVESSGTQVGHGTNFEAIFATAKFAYDRIFIFSDMQAWRGSTQKGLRSYMQRMGMDKQPTLYAFDLSGYGTMQFPAPNVYQIAGFSEKIFDALKLLEQDRQALISTIERIKL